MFDQVAAACSAGEDVKLANFGSFRVSDTPERIGRNPKTGEAAIVTFPSKEDTSTKDRLARLAELIDKLALPVILALGNGDTR